MKNHLKCFCVAILSDCVLVACSQEAVDWNEVPLAENVFFESQNESFGRTFFGAFLDLFWNLWG